MNRRANVYISNNVRTMYVLVQNTRYHILPRENAILKSPDLQFALRKDATSRVATSTVLETVG